MNAGEPINWLRLIALGVIWGASFMLVELAIRDFGPLSVAAARLTIAAAVLLPLALVRSGLPRSRNVWGFAAAIAILSNVLPFSLLSWAQGSIPSSLAAVFMAALPLVVLPLSHVLVPGEVMTVRKTIGLLLGFAGVMVLIGPDAIDAASGTSGTFLAQLACVGAAICYALGSITMKRAPRTEPIGFAALSMLLAAVLGVAIALGFEGAPASPGFTSLGALLVLGVVSTALALVIMLKILENAGPPFLSLVNYQVPVWGLVFGSIFLGESIPITLGLALALILGGVAISQWPTRRRGAN